MFTIGFCVTLGLLSAGIRHTMTSGLLEQSRLHKDKSEKLAKRGGELMLNSILELFICSTQHSGQALWVLVFLCGELR